MRPKPPSRTGRALGPYSGLLELSRDGLSAALDRLASAGRLEGLTLVDGTCGNGHDTLYLALCLRRLGLEGLCPLLAFDVQDQALAQAAERLKRDNVRGAHLLLRDHAQMGEALAERETPGVALAVYNLGFLPGSDKRVVTGAGSTLTSLEAVARLLVPDGLLCVHAYGGHDGGLEEMRAVDRWFRALPHPVWRAQRHEVCNKPRNPEALFMAVKEYRP